jgi:hypothetical protein
MEIGVAEDAGTRVVVELDGFGEERPSRGGNAEFGVLDTDVGAVDAESRLVEEADIGV